VARIDGLTVADEIRQAIAAHLEARRADPEFQERLHRAMERDREVYEHLRIPPVTVSPAGPNVTPLRRAAPPLSVFDGASGGVALAIDHLADMEVPSPGCAEALDLL
jgi:hypothetical protein